MPLKQSTLSQCYSNLSFTSQAMIIAASVVSVAGILYTKLVISEKYAHKKATDKIGDYKSLIIQKSNIGDDLTQIQNSFGTINPNPATFSFGLLGHNELQVHVNLGYTNIDTETQKVALFLDLCKKGSTKVERHVFDEVNKKWNDPIFFN